jgi:hypothetical protein
MGSFDCDHARVACSGRGAEGAVGTTIINDDYFVNVIRQTCQHFSYKAFLIIGWDNNVD